MKGAADHDWRALEFVSANDRSTGVRLVRSTPQEEYCAKLINELSPYIIIGDTCRTIRIPTQSSG